MALVIVPSIDLRGGRVVRLKQGDYGRQVTYDVDPVATARSFAEAGARWMHVVDLDGAKEGRPVQTDLISFVIRSTGLKVECGGGVRYYGRRAAAAGRRGGAGGRRHEGDRGLGVVRGADGGAGVREQDRAGAGCEGRPRRDPGLDGDDRPARDRRGPAGGGLPARGDPVYRRREGRDAPGPEPAPHARCWPRPVPCR